MNIAEVRGKLKTEVIREDGKVYDVTIGLPEGMIPVNVSVISEELLDHKSRHAFGKLLNKKGSTIDNFSVSGIFGVNIIIGSRKSSEGVAEIEKKMEERGWLPKQKDSLTPELAKKLIEEHFANLTPEQFDKNNRKANPHLYSDK